MLPYQVRGLQQVPDMYVRLVHRIVYDASSRYAAHKERSTVRRVQ
jgi:hypothetical protein